MLKFPSVYVSRRCVPVGWSVRRGSDSEPECHQRLCVVVWMQAMGAVVQLRTGAAGVSAAGVEGQNGKHCCRPAGIRQKINGTTDSFSFFFSHVYRVTTFLEFLGTCKCRGIWLGSGKRPEIRERSGNLCSWGNLIVAAQQNNLPVLYPYCNSFFFSHVMFTENLY